MDDPTATIDDFARLDIRVARIIAAEPLPGARKPAYALRLNCGPDLGVRTSSAQITEVYAPEDLVERLVLAIVNLPPRRVAGFKSEALTLGVYAAGDSGPVVLIRPDDHPDIRPGDRLG